MLYQLFFRNMYPSISGSIKIYTIVLAILVEKDNYLSRFLEHEQRSQQFSLIWTNVSAILLKYKPRSQRFFLNIYPKVFI